MNHHWDEIKQTLRHLACLDEVQLNSGASVEAIQQLEKHVDVERPQCLKELLMQHNGQADGPGLIYGCWAREDLIR